MGRSRLPNDNGAEITRYDGGMAPSRSAYRRIGLGALAALWLHASGLRADDAPAPEGAAPGIEGLSPPAPARPPRPDGPEDDDPSVPGADSLEQKRQERRRREQDLKPKPLPFAKKQAESLRQDALAPRPRRLLLELSMVISNVQTRGDREAYTTEPNTHFGVFCRHGAPAVDGKIGLWYGGRLAPFTGTGFEKKRPGTYGLTYFGPMIGVGKIDPVVGDDGAVKATSAAAEKTLPSTSGWLVSLGVAAVSKVSRSEDPDLDDPNSDFFSQGIAFDAPGVWMEARYLKVLYGGLGVDVLAGVQTGRDKLFAYGGLGLGFWY